MGSEVFTPWPESGRGQMSVMEPSRPSVTKALGVKAPAGAVLATSAAWASPEDLRTTRQVSPPPTVEVRRRNSRRSRAGRVGAEGAPVRGPFGGLLFGAGGGEFGGAVDAGTDAEIGAAAAEVAGHGVVNVLVGGLGVVGDERGGGHDLTGLAIAALGDVEVAPGFLERVGTVGGKTLDGDNRAPTDTGNRSHAGLNGLAADVDGAGAALADTAAELGADEVEVVAEDPEERGLGCHVHGAGLAVNLQGELSHRE